MVTRKSTSARILAVGCAFMLCLGGSFTWTGGGSTTDWDEDCNWLDTSICSGFPDDSNDDALIPARLSGNWVVGLVRNLSGAYVIDDLRIEGSVFIVANSGENPILTTDTVTIKGGATTDTRVRILSDGAQIEAGSCG